MPRALFIISTGRTGTTFFASLFRQFGMRSFHEPGPRWLRFVSNAYISGNLSGDRARRIIAAKRLDAVGAGTAPYVEASCFLYGMVRPILETIEDAYVVHVVRDPRSFVRSGMNWGMYRLGGRVLNLIPYRRLAEPQYGGRLSVSRHLRWAMKSQFQRLCWAWPLMNEAARRQGEGSDRFESIRYEDIFDSQRDYPGLRRICALGGVDLKSESLCSIASRPVNITEKRRFPDWRQWSPAQLEELLAQCAKEATHYGYDLVTEIRQLVARPDEKPSGTIEAS